jgi:sn-glycerol 3-phosphate transport system substrate-binding protein
MPLFYTQECAMTMGSSAGLAGIQENMKGIEVGVAELPYDDELIAKPQNTIIGGASLWVLRGHSSEEYKGVAKFFSYLSSAEVQADWHQFTGYLPITQQAYELTKQQGFYTANPGTDTAVVQMTSTEPTANSKGIRFGNFLQTRDIINEELEAVWAGKATAKSALNNAVRRGDEQLRRFERTQK